MQAPEGIPATVFEALDLGEAALVAGDWAAARAAFESAVAVVELPGALEGLGLAAWWLNDESATFSSRERAFRLYREHEDSRGAARCAIALAGDFMMFRGEGAVANGWITRAERLLEGLPPGLEHGWLAVYRAEEAVLWRLDAGAARRFGATAAEIGRTLGSVDLETVGRALEGLGLVRSGQVDDGMRRLDEATTAAVSGELSDRQAIYDSCCSLIFGCESVGDYARAAEWCARLKEICGPWSMRTMFAICRAHYAGVLIWRGAFSEAEDELVLASEELTTTRPAMVSEATVRLAELRRLQGRLDEAEALIARTEAHPLAILSRGNLALDRGDAASAEDLGRRFLRAVGHEGVVERAPGLEIVARATAAAGRIEEARKAAQDLRGVAQQAGTPALRAVADEVDGAVAIAAGNAAAARGHLEDALDGFLRGGAKYRAAVARLALAEVLAGAGRAGAAAREAGTALEVFDQLDAAPKADQARALLAATRENVAGSPAGEAANGLTRREVEVLRLVAAGQSNQQIATELVLSVRTVERHITNIYGKIDVQGRSAATAFAIRQGIA